MGVDTWLVLAVQMTIRRIGDFATTYGAHLDSADY